ncbi:predicted protein [Postia placenta Mad-698-R]|nr:predicted protein [Postia placenta Mad-698-R]
MAAPALVAGDFLVSSLTTPSRLFASANNIQGWSWYRCPRWSTNTTCSGYCYGMHIYPILGKELLDDESSKSSKSSKSGSSMHTDYEVWRRWEDCLWFQDLLESEYGLMARTKRQRLAAGKGIKKNGVYIHSDQAASFESLPPGPEANSIAKDIHEIVPKLTKKGTIFRASQSTIDQRGREFKAMIDSLWSDELPTLMKELRDTRAVRDFFGYWRRDVDHDKKLNPHLTSSGDDKRISHRGSLSIPSPVRKAEDARPTSARSSTGSTSSLWLARKPFLAKGAETRVGIEEVPFVLMGDGAHHTLQSLPEDSELVEPMNELSIQAPRPPRRVRISSCPDPTNRNCVIIEGDGDTDGDEDVHTVYDDDASAMTVSPSLRPSSLTPSMLSDFSTPSSWRTSIASEFSIATAMSSFPPDPCADERTVNGHLARYVPSNPARASIATINSLMSGTSVDAVLPRKWSPPPTNGLRRSLSAGSRRRPESSLSMIPIPTEEMWDGQQDDFVDAYFYDPTLRSASPDESVYSSDQGDEYTHFNMQPSSPDHFPKPFQDRPPAQFHLPFSAQAPSSPTSAAYSLTSPTGPETFAVKVILDDSIVLLRATYSMSFLEIRERIREKFAKQEGLKLPETFVIAYLPPNDRARVAAQSRARSNSCSTFGGDQAQPLRYISSDEEWQTAIASSAAKLTIRIFHARL